MWTEIGVGWILWNRGMGWQKHGNEMKQLAIYTLHLQKVAVDVSSSSGLVDSEKRSQSTCEPNGHSMEYMDPQPLLKWWFWTGFKPVTMAPTLSVDDAWCIDPVMGLVSQSAMIQAASSMQSYLFYCIFDSAALLDFGHTSCHILVISKLKYMNLAAQLFFSINQWLAHVQHQLLVTFCSHWFLSSAVLGWGADCRVCWDGRSDEEDLWQRQDQEPKMGVKWLLFSIVKWCYGFLCYVMVKWEVHE